MRYVSPLIIGLVLVCSPAPAQREAAKPWWMQQQRLLQTNLREIDATMDLDQYIQDVKDFGASVVLFNVGGIVANYPTDLEFHWRNTFMDGDLTDEVVRRLHAEGIRMIGRFDFSKINEHFAAQRPEWLYLSERGETVNYNGQVHTCISGGYQQEYMFEILGEAVDRYPLDGVFFNMIGFTRSDYSGNQHGICQCANCAAAFRAHSGLDLPTTGKQGTEQYNKYMQWTREVVARQFQRVHDFLKAKRPDLCICTYTDAGVDVIRKESNHMTPDWLYTDSQRARVHTATFQEKNLANAAVHFLRIQNRHTGTTPYLTARRLLQHAFNGTWLDFYCIGPLHRLEDRMVVPTLSEIFHFQAENERYFLDTVSLARTALVQRGGESYEGIAQLLSEQHMPFDVVRLADKPLPRYALLVVPDAEGLSPVECDAVDAYVKNGGRALLIGGVPDTLASAGTDGLLGTHRREPGTYLRIGDEDRALLGQPRLDDVDLAFLDSPLKVYRLKPETKPVLRFVPVGMFGPPEKCYYTETSEDPGMLIAEHGSGKVCTLPWDLGTQYRALGHPVHSLLFKGAIERLLGVTPRVLTNAPELVEISHRGGTDEAFEWVSLINHSGQYGNAVHAPMPLRDVSIEILPRVPNITSVRLLHAGHPAKFEVDPEGWVRVTIPKLSHYEVVLLE